MAYPSVTNTFVESTTAYASAVNQNFLDVVNGISDGTKDINVNNATVAGALSLTNALTARTILPAIASTYDLGSAAGAWNNVWMNTAYIQTATVSGAGRLQFRDVNQYVSSDNANYLDLHAASQVRVNGSLDVSGSATINGPLKISSGSVSAAGLSLDGCTEILYTYAAGTFDYFYTGISTAQTLTGFYNVIGKSVTLYLCSVYGVSTATSFSLPASKLPAVCVPYNYSISGRPVVWNGPAMFFDNAGNSSAGGVRVDSDGILFCRGAAFDDEAWTASGGKGVIFPMIITYLRQ